SPLPPLSFQYTDYAREQRAWMETEEAKRQLAYWKRRLGGERGVLRLPTDRQRPMQPSDKGTRAPFALSEGLAEKLRRFSREAGVTTFMTLLAAYKVLLHRYTGQEDLLVGVPVAGRTREEVEKLIGFFVNTVVIRTDLSGDPDFREVLRRVKEGVLEARAHQEVPFDKVVEALQPERDGTQSPLFQVMFNYERAEQDHWHRQGLSITGPERVATNTAKFEWCIHVKTIGNRMVCALEYQSELHSETAAKRVISQYLALLEGIVEQPDAAISCLPVLGKQARKAWVAEQRRGLLKLPEGGIHQRFEEQVKKNPNAIAVTFAQTQLSYGELNRQANRLARVLRQKGVGPNQLIGLSVERSPAMIIGILGILKAGGAYLPLDPSLPQQRLMWMVKDAGVSLVIVGGEAAAL
ncbi:condensation domain-containing protein, partial [Fischerella thermalis]|uniref:condensation domain-containing protein n=1 Tax=Fischerella thermalis TaxID=372787 RepID=UPI0011AF923A